MAKFLVGQFADRLTDAAAVDGEPKNVIIGDLTIPARSATQVTANCKILVKLWRNLRRSLVTQKSCITSINPKYKRNTADRNALAYNSLFR